MRGEPGDVDKDVTLACRGIEVAARLWRHFFWFRDYWCEANAGAASSAPTNEEVLAADCGNKSKTPAGCRGDERRRMGDLRVIVTRVRRGNEG